MSDISVIIRVKNEDRWIGHCIQSILDLVRKPQIIIINDGSTDESLKIASLFRHDTSLPFDDPRYADLQIYNIDHYSPGKAINLGATLAHSDTVMVISAHCVLKAFNLKIIAQQLLDHVAIFGQQVPYYHGKRLKKTYLWSHFGLHPSINMFSDLEDRYFFHNAFSIFRKTYLSEHPMNEDLVGKEDRYWAEHVVKSNLTYIYEPSLIVDHHFTSNGNTWRGIG